MTDYTPPTIVNVSVQELTSCVLLPSDPFAYHALLAYLASVDSAIAYEQKRVKKLRLLQEHTGFSVESDVYQRTEKLLGEALQQLGGYTVRQNQIRLLLQYFRKVKDEQLQTVSTATEGRL